MEHTPVTQAQTAQQRTVEVSELASRTVTLVVSEEQWQALQQTDGAQTEAWHEATQQVLAAAHRQFEEDALAYEPDSVYVHGPNGEELYSGDL